MMLTLAATLAFGGDWVANSKVDPITLEESKSLILEGQHGALVFTCKGLGWVSSSKPVGAKPKVRYRVNGKIGEFEAIGNGDTWIAPFAPEELEMGIAISKEFVLETTLYDGIPVAESFSAANPHVLYQMKTSCPPKSAPPTPPSKHAWETLVPKVLRASEVTPGGATVYLECRGDRKVRGYVDHTTLTIGRLADGTQVKGTPITIQSVGPKVKGTVFLTRQSWYTGLNGLLWFQYGGGRKLTDALMSGKKVTIGGKGLYPAGYAVFTPGPLPEGFCGF